LNFLRIHTIRWNNLFFSPLISPGFSFETICSFEIDHDWSHQNSI
jgi:hypothetical protein